QITVRQRVEIAGQRQATQRDVERLHRNLALLDGATERLGDEAAWPVERAGRGLDQDGLEAVRRAHLGDAAAHRARTDYGDRIQGRHRSSSHARFASALTPP